MAIRAIRLILPSPVSGTTIPPMPIRATPLRSHGVPVLGTALHPLAEFSSIIRRRDGVVNVDAKLEASESELRERLTAMVRATPPLIAD